ncbi:WD40/YVTN/BNR-like repeat-containing protein [Duganella radicis]|uniref:Glycosyl hydrolase n=1 Tax=Duganella radicis TaxID=551988 RepID=A0A6L6PB53_9BURK|nr:YCF48-related protein [Duganella radicis]MTV36023.1 glycosyl hydrolase [Duganella radicis]
MNMKFLTTLTLACATAAACAGAAPGTAPGLTPQPAVRSAYAVDAAILGVANAGKRIVGVGDYGVVLLSDDQGRTFRQARAVPVSSTLTGVSFADERNGWAVGHWGVILRTTDGGETWTVQRSDTQEDRPLFSVHFFDDKEGIAVGLWSLVLVTRDGGAHWQPLSLPTPPDGGKADRNLLSAFTDAHGNLYVAAERGMVLRSEDRGRSWHYLDTGYKGSFWSGVALRNGVVLVGGLRGSLYRSADGGNHWQAIDSGVKSSITGMVERADGVVEAVGLDGAMLESRDGGLTFKARQRDDRLSLTGVIGAGNEVLRFSKRGIAAR